MNLIKVIDEHGKTYSSTYYKRAKGLVKKNRARWVDESTICLVLPVQKKENKMKNIDFDRLISLTVAGNYAIKNRSNDDYHLGRYAIKALCDTYDGIIDELEEGNIVVEKALDRICFDNIEGPIDANKLHDLENLVYTKNCLLNPILKIEKAKFEKNKTINNLNQNKNININLDNGINIKVENGNDYTLDDLNEELLELRESYNDYKKDLDELNLELSQAQEDIEVLNDERSFLENEIEELRQNILNNSDDEELDDLQEELEEKISELSDINEEISELEDEIEEIQGDIADTQEDLKEVMNDINIVKEKISKLKNN